MEMGAAMVISFILLYYCVCMKCTHNDISYQNENIYMVAPCAMKLITLFSKYEACLCSLHVFS